MEWRDREQCKAKSSGCRCGVVVVAAANGRVGRRKGGGLAVLSLLVGGRASLMGVKLEIGK